ncbi:MAG: PLP-dependent aminotransferase family protein [Trebonia sp.]|jgi:GntR family transcriptional regulator/MocR family aminotransferase
MTTLPSGLPVMVDRAGSVPLAVQISAQLEAAVTGGVLHAGDRLPSSRDLAGTLGVSRTVVTNAYARLFAEGWLEGRHGSGTYVADVTPEQSRGSVAAAGHDDSERERVSPRPAIPATGPSAVMDGTDVPTASSRTSMNGSHLSMGGSNASRADFTESAGPARVPGIAAAAAPGILGQPDERPGRAALIDLQPGISWAEGIEPAAWRRAWRQAGAHLPSRMPDPYGLPELREEIAGYLRRSRGLAVRPEQVLVTQGVSSGLALIADALLTAGDEAGIEEPGYPTGREVLHRAGARVVPCRVDAHGIVPEELPGGLRLLYTTPAHQYPLGGRLPVSRRQALIAWARATGAIIVEDDYDSEFRYDVGPLPALHSMDPDVIVYLGTASKVLATAFGAGWLVAPPALVDQLAALRPRLGARIPEPVQHAILALLRSGDLERHVRKMRLEYARRRAALVDGLIHSSRDATGIGLTHPGPDVTGVGRAPSGDDGATPAQTRMPFRLLGDTAGMHIVLELADDIQASRLIDAAAERGIRVYSLDRYFAGEPAINGLIIGYGTATLPQIRRASAELAQLLTQGHVVPAAAAASQPAK